jgi:hypothetical protein
MNTKVILKDASTESKHVIVYGNYQNFEISYTLELWCYSGSITKIYKYEYTDKDLMNARYQSIIDTFHLKTAI